MAPEVLRYRISSEWVNAPTENDKVLPDPIALPASLYKTYQTIVQTFEATGRAPTVRELSKVLHKPVGPMHGVLRQLVNRGCVEGPDQKTSRAYVPLLPLEHVIESQDPKPLKNRKNAKASIKKEGRANHNSPKK